MRARLSAGTARLGALLCLIIACHAAGARPIVVFLSDFGLENEAVGLCHGAMLAINDELQIVNLTHAVTPFNIRLAGDILARATTFPAGTVFVAVVDPGVGTRREAIAIRTRRDYYFIAPDNGLLTAIMETQGVSAARRIDPKLINPDWKPGTFDGRDLFTPAAARLATSGGKLEQLGPECDAEKIVRLEHATATWDEAAKRIDGHYLRTDQPYGNVWTDVPAELFAKLNVEPGDELAIGLGDAERRAPFQKTFGDVAEGEPLVYINSDGRVALAINMGNLREAWQLTEGQPISIRKAAD